MCGRTCCIVFGAVLVGYFLGPIGFTVFCCLEPATRKPWFAGQAGGASISAIIAWVVFAIVANTLSDENCRTAAEASLSNYTTEGTSYTTDKQSIVNLVVSGCQTYRSIPLAIAIIWTITTLASVALAVLLKSPPKLETEKGTA